LLVGAVSIPVAMVTACLTRAHTFDQVWARFLHDLRMYSPASAATLQPGATAEQIAHLETVHGFALHSDVRVLRRGGEPPGSTTGIWGRPGAGTGVRTVPAGAVIGGSGARPTRVNCNICLNQLTSARVRRETYVGQWLPEPLFAGDPMLGPADTEHGAPLIESW
jgi:hypothetical protein